MAMDDLLKEAIADAKAVRETALANAKAALEEAFAPKLQSMLNATLQNETEFEEEAVGAPIEEPIEEPSAEELTAQPAIEPVATDVSAAQLTGAEDEEGFPTDEAFSLESIVKELEEEAAAAEEPQAPIEEKTDEEADLEEAASSTAFGTGDNKKPAAGASETSTEDPQGSIKANHPAAKEGKHGEINESDEDVNLDELINELKAEYSEATAPSTETEMAELKKSLNEHREVIKFLRGKLNEVNLLNAKLLFTNKLFKNHSMNESQKLRVIETLDRATTLKECKLVYSTLEEAYIGMRQPVKKSPAKKIAESIASKPVDSTKPSEETAKTIINEGNDLAARFQKLAGIIK